jgi:lysophospholipase L1-like esterase
VLECLIIGDSIAVGTKQFMPQCELQGKGGINTWQFNKMYPGNFASDAVIISLGSNDHKHIKTYDELLATRKRVTSGRVYWVLPAGNLKASEVPIEQVQASVRKIAEQYGDTVLPITRLQADGIHPAWAGYKAIAEATQ